jgi:hypothetical protein
MPMICTPADSSRTETIPLATNLGVADLTCSNASICAADLFWVFDQILPRDAEFVGVVVCV